MGAGSPARFLDPQGHRYRNPRSVVNDHAFETRAFWARAFWARAFGARAFGARAFWARAACGVPKRAFTAVSAGGLARGQMRVVRMVSQFQHTRGFRGRVDPSHQAGFMMTQLTESVANLIDQLARLPGIGKKSAERLAYYLLRVNELEAFALADAIRHVRENVRYCSVCFNLAESELCRICEDPKRDRTLLCVVEQPRDLMSLEASGTYAGLYHVLLGRIAPLDGIGPDQLTLDALVERVLKGTFKEVIMATNPTVEGDGTALHISNLLAEFPVEMTRLARGITTGSILEYTNKEILADALSGRQKF